MYNDNSSSPTLTNVTFSGNSAERIGGGMVNSSVADADQRHLQRQLRQPYNGGGMYNYASIRRR